METPETTYPADTKPEVTYQDVIKTLAEDILGSTEDAEDLEANVDRYMEDLTQDVLTKAQELMR